MSDSNNNKSFSTNYDNFGLHKLPTKIEDWENYSAVLNSTDYVEVKSADEIPCYALYLKYLNTAFMRSNVLKVAIENNPCILRDFETFDPMDESEWMRQFRRFVHAGLAVALLPAAIELLGPIVAEIVVAGGPTVVVATKEQAAINFGVGATTEFFCGYFFNYFTKDSIDFNCWIDICSDAGQAGTQNIIKFSKYERLYNAGLDCFSNVDITEIPDIFNNEIKFRKVATDCGIGALFGLVFSSKYGKKILNFLNNLSHEQLLKLLRRKLPYITPLEELTIISMLGKKTDAWTDNVKNVLKKKEGIAAFNFLK